MQEAEKDKPMFVITRKVGEAICLGDDVVVRVERIWPDRVGLQVIAPNTMPVHRGEVQAAIRASLRSGGES